MIKVLAAFFLLSGVVFAQGTRIGDDRPVQSIVQDSRLVTSAGVTPQFITAPGAATINICSRPANAVPCTNKATTYTDATTATPCSTSTQVVLAGTTSCVAASDSGGNWGAWVKSGNYDFTVTIQGFSFGPFTVSAGTAGFANTCFADQQAGADMGIKIQACMSTFPSTGGVVDARAFQGAQTWSTNIFASSPAAPITILLGPATININVAQSPNTPSQRILGLGGTGYLNGNGISNTTLVVNFATGDVFTPGPSGNSFELGYMAIKSGVTRTSGFLVNPAAGASGGYVHDVHIQDQYGVFKLFAASGTPLGGWKINNLTYNCSSASLHAGSFLWLGSSDNSVFSSGHQFNNWFSTGALCIQDAPQILIDSNVDSPLFVNLNFSISRTNTSTQPNWKFQHTLAGGVAPRLARLINVMSEGNGLAGNDIINVVAGTDIDFIGCDIGGGDHAYNISGGQGIKIIGGQVNNNNNGGIYVTAASTFNGLRITGVDFYGNSVGGAGATDDIQIADGSSDVSIIGNNFGEITSTVTANLTRWPINFLGTTSTLTHVFGNHEKLANYLNSGLVRDVTAAQGLSESGDGRTLIMDSSNGNRIWNINGAGHLSWEFGCQDNVNNGCEVTPSTANGGVTFTTPSVQFNNTGMAVRASFTPIAAAGSALGTNALPFSNYCVGTAATNNICTSVSAMAAARTLTVPDPLGAVTMPYVIASGTSTMASGSVAGATCATAVTTAATNTLTTDSIEWAYATAPTLTTDALLHISPYVTAGNVNFTRCNPTAGAIVGTAIVINWRVIR